MTTAHTATPAHTKGQLGDIIEIDSTEVVIDWPATDERHECGSDHYPITLTSGDPDELAANAERVKLCWNVHDDLVKALKFIVAHNKGEAWALKEAQTGYTTAEGVTRAKFGRTYCEKVMASALAKAGAA